MRPALPRPPAATCPFTTHGPGGSTAVRAAAALSIRQPAGTATPRAARSCLASCSSRYMRGDSLLLAFEERSHEAPRLVGPAGFDAGPDAGLHRLLDRHALPVADQRLLQPHCARAGGEDRRNPALHSGIEVGGPSQPFQETYPVSFLGVDRVPGIDQLAGLAPADKEGQQAGFHAGRNAETNLGHAEAGGGDADPQVAGGGNLHAGAETVADRKSTRLNSSH